MTIWSPEQLKAIELRNRELLVSAAAGSGKTSVLVERIVGMVTDETKPIDVDKLLIVTFTKAAAAEMRTRLYKRLLQAAEEHPDNKHIRRQLTLIGQAHVQTIDSFCSYVLRNYFHTINLDPGFRTGDEGELALLERDVLEDLMEQKYEEASPEFIHMMEYFVTEKMDNAFLDTILKIYKFSQSSPNPDKWLDACVAPYRIKTAEELNAADWNRNFLQICKQTVTEYQADYQEMMTLVRDPEGPGYLDTFLTEEGRIFDGLLRAQTYEDYYNALAQVTFKTKPRAKKGDEFSPELGDRVSAIRDSYKSGIKELQGEFAIPVEAVLEDLSVAAPAVEELIHTVRTFSENLSAEKQRLGVISFSDGEHLALKILWDEAKGAPTAVAEAIAEEFEEILIDEYQDSNYLQETILRAVSKERDGRHSIFMVGDMKQSIYRFRMACPDLFVEKYNRFDAAEEEPTENGQKIELNANFRSRPEVTDAVNHVFKRVMRHEVGQIDYTSKEALYPKGTFAETELPTAGTAELLLLCKSDETIAPAADDSTASATDGTTAPATDDPEAQEEQKDLSNAELEAEMIAAEIKKLVDKEQGLYIQEREKGYRKASYKDIVILMRSLTYGPVFADILASHGIPCYVDRKTGFFDTSEIRLALNFLRVIDNPIDDVAMAAVLMSPICNFTPEDMVTIRTDAGEWTPANGLYGLLKEFLYKARKMPERAELLEKVENVWAILEFFRVKSRDLSLPGLLRLIYRETNMLNFYGAMPGGERRVANLNHLITRAADYENLCYTGVFNFVRYIEKKRELNADEGEVSTAGENEDLVRIVTIHGSKGLEYPVVFVANTHRKFNTSDANASIILHQDMGVGIGAVRLDERTETNTYYKHVMGKMSKRESYGEELRVLYVAMTRAKEKLYLTGVTKDLPDPLYDERPVATKDIMGGNCYLKWCLRSLTEDAPIKVRTVYEKNLAPAIPEIATEPAETRFLDDVMAEPFPKAISEEIEAMLSFDYHIDDLSDVPASMSVSALKQAAMHAGDDPDDERVFRAKPMVYDNRDLITGAALGTLYHRVMEKMIPGETAADGIDRMTALGLTSELEKSTIDTTKVDGFWQSELGNRFRMAFEAGKGFREKQFIIALPIETVLPSVHVKDPEETVMIQGVVDMYFEEPDGLVLVDYKTDRVSNEDVLTMRYRTQLEYYAKALEMLTGKTVKEKWIYSFALEKEISL